MSKSFTISRVGHIGIHVTNLDTFMMKVPAGEQFPRAEYKDVFQA